MTYTAEQLRGMIQLAAAKMKSEGVFFNTLGINPEIAANPELLAVANEEAKLLRIGVKINEPHYENPQAT